MDTLDLPQLKVIAKDLEDLQIIAAHLQDALIPLLSFQHNAETETFTALANRFCWEHAPLDHEGAPLYHRVHSGLCIHHVKKVHKKGFQSTDTNQLYNLMTINGQNEGALHLVFSDGHEIRVEIEHIHLKLGDVSHPWPTRHAPKQLHEHV